MSEAMMLCLLEPQEGAFHGNPWTDILKASSGPCRNSPPEAVEEWGFLLVPHKELSVETNLCPELGEI